MSEYAECFICLTKMCLRCLPYEYENSHRGLIPVCSGCQERHKNKSKMDSEQKDENKNNQ